ncbi:hypothetical protein B9G55_19890 [Saccharibacillus sp. O16]|nr:hypothetical protein B9G55_19890 [Saccharibacillus sp. O16]
MKAKKVVIKLLALLILLGYGALLLYMMFWGFGRSAHISGEFRYNIVPFETIRLFARSADWDNIRAPFINLVGNVAVFIPFGVLLPILFRRCRNYLGFIGRFLLLILALELAQGVLGAGVADVDDLILNGIGATLGYIVYRVFGGSVVERSGRASVRSRASQSGRTRQHQQRRQ